MRQNFKPHVSAWANMLLLMLFMTIFSSYIVAEELFYLKQEHVALANSPLEMQLQSSNLPLNLHIYKIKNPQEFLLKQNLLRKMQIEETSLREELNQALQTSTIPNKPLVIGNVANLPVESQNFIYCTSKEVKELTNPGTDGYSTVTIENIKEPGLYLVEAERQEYIAYTLSLISDLGMITRRTTNEILIYTVHRATGQPYPNTKVVAYSQGKILGQGVSNQDGLLKLDVEYQPQICILAYNEQQVTSDDPRFFPNLVSGIKGYIFTERPLYLPGETVYFKGLLRELNQGIYNIPQSADNSVICTIQDPQKNVIQTITTMLNLQASWSSEFKLTDNVALGQYIITAKWNNRKFQTEFQVQQFTKPQLQASVKAKKSAIVAGETANFEITGKYFAGGVIDKGTVQYQVYRSQFEQPLFEKIALESFYSSNEYRSFKSEMISSGQLDMKDGKANLEIRTEASDVSFSYRVQVTIRDESRNIGVSSASVKAMPAAIRMDLETNKQLYNLEEDIQITVKAVDLQNQPIATDFEIDVVRQPRKLLAGGSQPNTPAPETEVKSERIALLKGRTGDNGQAVVSAPAALAGEIQLLLSAKDYQGKKVTAERAVWASRGMEPVPYSGNAVQIILDKKAYSIGETARVLILIPTVNIAPLITLESSWIIKYEVQRFTSNSFMAEIPITEDMTPNIYMRVSAIAENGFMEAVQNVVIPPINKIITITITPDQPGYAPRQKATLNIQAKDYQGKPVQTDLSLAIVDTALLALASDNNASLSLFFYPLQRKNVSSSSSIQQLAYDYAHLSPRLQKYWEKIRAEEQAKQLADANRLRELRRQEERLRELQSDGQQRIGAADRRLEEMRQRALSAENYEEAIEQSAGRPTVHYMRSPNTSAPPPPAPAARPLSMRDTGSAPPEPMPESAAEGSMDEMEADDALSTTVNKKVSGGSSKDTSLSMLERNLFQTTAVWMAYVSTDEQGKAQVNLTWPDNLTTWQVTAKAIDVQTRVGEVQIETVTRRPVYVASNQPQYLIQRDQLQWEISATNTTEQSQELSITHSPSAEFVVNSETKLQQNVEAGKTLRGNAILLANKTGSATLSAQVANQDTMLDAVKQPIVIRAHGILQSQGASGLISNERTEISALNLPKKATNAKLTVRIFPSYHQVIQDSLKMLVEYPHGCTEQTMSRFMPNLVAKNVLHWNLAKGEEDLMNKNIEAGLKNLYELQHTDGGWGWWKEDESTPWMTAYVAMGLVHAKNFKFDVPQEKLTLARKWMEAQIKNSNVEYAQRAYLLRALQSMGSTQMAVAEELLDSTERLQTDAYTIATLALFFHQNKRPDEVKALVAQLNKMAKTVEGKNMTYWGETSAYRWHTNAVGVTAHVVRILDMVDSKNPSIVAGLEWLMSQRHATGWNSTKDTAEVIYTICEYIHGNTNPTDNNCVIKIQAVGTEAELKVANDVAVWTAPADLLQAGNAVSIALVLNEPVKGLTYTAGLSYLIDDDLIAASNNDLKITREYYWLQETQKATNQSDKINALVYADKPMPEIMNDKELVMVKIQFTLPQNYDYVMVEDPLPATAQVVKEDRNIALNNPIESTKWTHREFQHHQALFFYRQLSAGTYTICYYFRTSFAGTFHALPSQVSLMYYPEIRGNGAESKLQVK